MPQEWKRLKVETENRVTRITIDRPDVLNAADGVMHEELSRVFRVVAADPECDVVVLTGAGKAFCAGGDLEWLEGMMAEPGSFERIVGEAKEVVLSMLDLPKPLIGRLNGDAVGLGATLALCCDMVVASDNARFGDPHVRAGLVAGDGAAVLLPQIVGYMRAREFLMLGGLVDAQAAKDLGIYNRVVPAAELDNETDAIVKRLLKGAQPALNYTKIGLNRELVKLATEKMDMLMAYEALSAASADHAEAVRALREKRKPVFGGGRA